MSAVKLANSLHQRGHEITFIPRLNTHIHKYLNETNIDVIPLRLKRHFDPISSIKLVKIIQHKQIDVIHIHLSRDLVHSYWAVRLGRKVPVILQKQVSSNITKKDFFHRQLYSQVSKIFVLSNFLKQNMLDTCPITADKIIVLPGGVRLEDYKPDPGVRKRLRNEWKIAESEIVVGSIGRIDRGKGYEELLHGFINLLENGLEVRLVIVGEPTVGEPEFALKFMNQIKYHNLEHLVTLTGFRSDIPQVLSAFDIFVLPSHGEAFGYVFVEALAACIPVIATNAGGVPDIIEDGKCGFLVPPYDVKSLTNAMHKLLTDLSLRERFSFSGYERVKHNFDENTILHRIEEEYYKLIEPLSL